MIFILFVVVVVVVRVTLTFLSANLVAEFWSYEHICFGAQNGLLALWKTFGAEEKEFWR